MTVKRKSKKSEPQENPALGFEVDPMHKAGTKQGRRKTPPLGEAADEIGLDPLYVIFEQHLYNFHDSNIDRKTFLGNVVGEYVAFLRKSQGIVIPSPFEKYVVEELSIQVNAMLVKKIYGCLSIHEYQEKNSSPQQRKRAEELYKQLLASRINDDGSNAPSKKSKM